MTIFKKVAVGISGGVDSAVAAYLLKSKGFDVHGVYMKNWDSINEMGRCTTEKDYRDAEIVCQKLDIPLIQVNFVKQYWNEVFTYLTREYEMGFTPNPDILCNRKVKFKCFHEYCRNNLMADAIATGHYANTTFGPYLEKYEDGVEQEPLRRTMFPLATMKKSTVREIARKQGLLNVASKRDSNGICFVGPRRWKSFISEYISAKPGNFIDIENGKIVGTHNGFHEWTLGQRCKLGGLTHRYFVVKKNQSDNSIYVVGDTEHLSLKTKIILTDNPNWIYDEPDILKRDGVFKCYFRYQHTKPFVNCLMMKTKNGLILHLDTSLRAVTPGQYAIFYNDEECYGSARIASIGPTDYVLNDNSTSIQS